MSLTKKRKYEAMLLYLNAHHLELYGKIDNLLEDSNATLEDIRGAIEDYTLIESSFATFKNRFGPAAAAPPRPPDPADSAPGVALTEKDIFSRSATFRKSMDNNNTKGEK